MPEMKPPANWTPASAERAAAARAAAASGGRETAATGPASGEAPALGEFLAKWRAREPEMALGELFCPPVLRPRFRAWGVLLHELREVAFELSEPRVQVVKGGWWAEELLAIEAGRPRHPVSHALADVRADWRGLARALPRGGEDDDARPGSADAAFAQLAPLAEALLRVEDAVFGHDAPRADADAREALVAHLLLERLRVGLASGDAGRVPLAVLARHGLTRAQLAEPAGAPALRDWAAEVAARLPRRLPGATAFRRVRASFDRQRLEALAAGRGAFEPRGPGAVWRAWRAARGGRT